LILLSAFVWFGCKVEESDPVAAAKDQIIGGTQATVSAVSAVAITDSLLSSQDYDSGATLPTSAETVLEVIGAGMIDQMISAIGDYFEYIGVYKDVKGSLPPGVSSLAFEEGETSASVRVTISGATFSASTVSITDGYDTYGYNGEETGSLSLPNVSLTASFTSLNDEGTAMKASAEASLASSCTNMRYAVDEDYVYNSGTSTWEFTPIYADYTINAGKLNANVKGAVLLESSETAGSVSYNAAASVSAGAVISPVAGLSTMGGKFIMTLSFGSKATVSYSEDSTGEPVISGDSVNMNLSVTVYDNSNVQQGSPYTFTIDDLMTLGDTSDIPLSIRKAAKKLTSGMIKK
jgi:hypothetical protein